MKIVIPLSVVLLAAVLPLQLSPYPIWLQIETDSPIGGARLELREQPGPPLAEQ